ncbi:Lecithin [Carpediemonas membranifera]|uniref:Lecithin n=1 Tax=Carpediemonas membranifera TaxID=201153 RepID=A0A8J6B0N4_9EUKA|nr:Lecithin [Carpediemonas membranifera]|eukprot:KAG9390482.1 Lecithin [Carpediemonas membranifera]
MRFVVVFAFLLVSLVQLSWTLSEYDEISKSEAADFAQALRESNDGVLHPILFVPGLFGSRLEWKLDGKDDENLACSHSTKGKYDQFWITIPDMLPFEDSCWIRKNKLGLTAEGHTIPQPGVDVRPAHWPLVRSVEYLTDTVGFKELAKYAHNFFQLLRGMGYTDNVNILAHPYDFRASPIDYFDPSTGVLDKFAGLVEHMYATNGNTPVVLVGHSMGVLVATLCLGHQTQEWKDKYIHQAVFAGGPLGGAPDLVGAVINAPGEFPLVPPVYASESTFVPALQTWCGGIWLAPDSSLLTEDNLLIKHDGKDYKLSDMDEFLRTAAAAEPAVARCFEKTRGLFTEQCENDCAPGVDLTILYGTSFKTNAQYELIKGEFGQPLKDLKAKVTGHVIGDGTVPMDSALTLPRRWEASGNNGHPIKFIEVLNVKHNDLVCSSAGAKTLFKAIFGQ